MGLISVQEVDLLDVSLIRKIFKPILLPFINEFVNKPYNQRGQLELKITFDFNEEFYKNVFNTFHINPAIKKIGFKKFKPNSVTVDKSSMNELVKHTSSDLFIALVDKLLPLTDNILEVKIELINQNIFVKGKYLKYSREIGQSPWEVNGVKICHSSVEDEISKTIKTFFNADNCIMSAGGREDRDVRMVGSGRPFIMEIYNPKINNDDVNELQKRINEGTNLVEVKDLAYCTKDYFSILKKYEDSKHKFYTCVVWCSKDISEEDITKINSVKELNIIQKTPIRVMHRRALMDRKKTIFSLSATPINKNFIV